MVSPLHPAVFRHLQTVQRSTNVGVFGFFRRQVAPSRSERSVYRWQRSLGDALLVVPSIAVEHLGLSHLHVFVHGPGSEWLRLPYAIEAAWVTPDLSKEVLYLRCLIPTAHETRVIASLKELACQSYHAVTSGSGWQQFLLSDDEPLELPIPDKPAANDLLVRCPFVVPAMMESWQYPNSLPILWERIHQRLGTTLRSFLPRTRIHYVNGKGHVNAAFQSLRHEGLIRQHVIRYHPLLAASIEVFVLLNIDRGRLAVFLQELRSCLHAVESYPTSDGYFCRLLGPHKLLDAIITRSPIPASRVFFHTKRYPTPLVRFSYEKVFDPVTGSWRVA